MMAKRFDDTSKDLAQRKIPSTPTLLGLAALAKAAKPAIHGRARDEETRHNERIRFLSEALYSPLRQRALQHFSQQFFFRLA